MIAETSTQNIGGRPAAILLALSILLVAVVQIPAMVDYVNHLARIHVLVAGSPFYVQEWGLYPNLAVDIVAPLLARFVGVDVALKMFFALGQILIVGGAAFLEKTIKGRQEFGALAALLLLFAIPFGWGLLNFQFGTGVALFAIAAWLRLSSRRALSRLVVHSAFVAVLYFSHLFALGIYGLAIGLIELANQRRPKEFFLMALPAAAILLAARPGQGLIDWVFILKILWPFIMWNPLNPSASSLIALGVFAICATMRSNRTGCVILTGFAVLYIVFPRRIMDSAFADVRLIAALLLILPGFLESRRPRIATRLLVLIVTANLTLTAWQWRSFQADYDEFARSFESIPNGSRVLIAQGIGPRVDPLFYAAALSAVYSTAFVPQLYTHVRVHPLRKAIAGYEVEDSMDYLPVDVTRLNTSPPSFARSWSDRYDLIYVLNDNTSWPNPIFKGRHFTVYKSTR